MTEADKILDELEKLLRDKLDIYLDTITCPAEQIRRIKEYLLAIRGN